MQPLHRPLLQSRPGRAKRADLQSFGGRKQHFRQVCYGFEQHARMRGLQLGRARKRADHPNGSDSSRMGHLDVFGRIAHVNAIRSFHAHTTHRRTERRGVRFSTRSILGANTRRKQVLKSKLPELPENALSVTAGDQPQCECAAEFLEHGTRSRQQTGILFAISACPELVS